MSIRNVRYGDRNANCCVVTADYAYFTYGGNSSTSYVTDRNLTHLASSSIVSSTTTLRMVSQDNQTVFRDISGAVERLYYNGSTLATGRHFSTGQTNHVMSFELSDTTHLWLTSGALTAGEVYLMDTTYYVAPNDYGYLYASVKNAKNICCTTDHVCLGYDDRIEYYTYAAGTLTLRATIYQTGQYQFLYNSTQGYLYVATGSGIIAIEATGAVNSPTLTIVDSVSGSFTGIATRGEYLVALGNNSPYAYIYKIIEEKLTLIDIYRAPSNLRPTVCDVYGTDIYLCTQSVPVKLELSSTPLGVLNQQLIY